MLPVQSLGVEKGLMELDLGRQRKIAGLCLKDREACWVEYVVGSLSQRVHLRFRYRTRR